ncbi:MAG TPA: hypothetical protein VFO34_12205 [Candidatus Acidoferrales bacterium]|nr:hypothetical protein [Candidatus Acidoferrales bacterium]
MIERVTRISATLRMVAAALALSLALGASLAIAKKLNGSGAGPAPLAAPSRAAATRRAAPSPAGDPAPAIAALKSLEFRNIGPAVMGGRIDDYAVDENNSDIIYVGTAAGGIFKTVNGGNTWNPIFEHELSASIGCITIASQDDSIIWVGTGEANNRQSASYGAGVYRSLDGGRTWKAMGLENTQAIARIVVDPHDVNTVYVAALGGLWNANHERGVFKTTDGGKTWNQVLYINDDTGVTDLRIDKESPNILYAAAYERRRTVWGFNGGGPDGGIYKTNDNGATWRKITSGMPYADGSDVGRIAISVYPKNTNIVYARIQSLHGGIYRSEDKGETWNRQSDTDPRPMYFGVLAVDPNNDLRIWVPGAPLYFSEDGGKTFVTTRGNGVHSDYHGFWIDPHDSNHMIVGVDGGIYFTRDAGRTWDHDNIIAIGQFYEVTADNKYPYTVCGGLQDNGSWCGPSGSLKGPIVNTDWVNVSGGDGFYNKIDTEGEFDYAESQDGGLVRRDIRTMESKSIRPREKEGEPPYRFQWSSPIELSSFDRNTVFYGGNFLFKSTDRGDSWVKLGPDLTNNEDRRQLKILGKLPTRDELSREDGVEWWPCITVINESPVNKDVLWVGTDDGNLQVTRDGGKNWTNVAGRVPGVPKGTYVSRVVASKYAEGTAYAAFDGHRMGDFKIYLFVTTDYGQNWRAISSGITEKDGIVHVVREDPKVQGLLYAGTERGLFISFDRGSNWSRFQLNLPTGIPVDDILIHPKYNDMILGTHARSIWILDDITPIQQVAQAMDSDVKLFDVRPTTSFRSQGGRGGGGFGFGTHAFEGANPPDGALLNFYLKNPLGERDRLTITISDSSGKTVREIQCRSPRAPAPGIQVPPELAAAGITAAQINGFIGAANCTPSEGVNRLPWDLRMSPPVDPQQALAGGGGGGFFGGGGRGPLVDPGTYTVKITLGDKSDSKSVTVSEDPRIQMSDADRAKRHDAIMKAFELSRDSNNAQRAVTGIKTALDGAINSWQRPQGQGQGGPGGAQAAAAEQAAPPAGGGGGRGGRGGGGGGGRGAGGGGGAAQAAGPAPIPVPDNVRKAAEDLQKQVNEVSGKFVNPQEEGGEQGGAGPALVYRPPTLTQRIGQVLGGLQGITTAPTPDELAEIDLLTKELAEVTPKIDQLREGLASLNKLMNDSSVPHIVVPQNVPGGRGRRGGEIDN